MKQQINKVNSKTGALKQTKSTFQILNRIPVKAMTLVVLFNLTLAQLSFSQGDDSIGNSYSFVEPAGHSTSLSNCCAAEKPVSPTKKSVVKIDLPSARMINRSDREVTMNLIRSLHVNRVKDMSDLMKVADQAMNAFFVNETSIGRTAHDMIRTADEDINLVFAAEHIRPVTVATQVNADEELTSIFKAENGVLAHNYGSVAVADATIDAHFATENTTISLPAAYTVSADAEINHNMDRDNLAKTTVAKVSAKK